MLQLIGKTVHAPMVERIVGGTIRSEDEAERSHWRVCIPETHCNKDVRYSGAEPWRHRYVSTASRNVIRSATRKFVTSVDCEAAAWCGLYGEQQTLDALLHSGRTEACLVTVLADQPAECYHNQVVTVPVQPSGIAVLSQRQNRRCTRLPGCFLFPKTQTITSNSTI